MRLEGYAVSRPRRKGNPHSCTWRVLYVAKIADAIYILHAFQKKGRKTNRKDVELARKRLTQIGGAI
jgi:phage-related protein